MEMHLHLWGRGLHLRWEQQKSFIEHLGEEHRDIGENIAWTKGRIALRLSMASK